MMKENFASFTDRQPLFPGVSCYPLSPTTAKATPEEKEKRKAMDQLSKIFEVIGTPQDESDLEFLESPDSQKYVQSFTPRERI